MSESLGKSAVAVWATQIERTTAPMFAFVRKALQQQLATAANLVRKIHKTIMPALQQDSNEQTCSIQLRFGDAA